MRRRDVDHADGLAVDGQPLDVESVPIDREPNHVRTCRLENGTSARVARVFHDNPISWIHQ